MASSTRRTSPTIPELPFILSSVLSSTTSISANTFIIPLTAMWFYSQRHLLVFTLLCLVYVLLFPYYFHLPHNKVVLLLCYIWCCCESGSGCEPTSSAFRGSLRKRVRGKHLHTAELGLWTREEKRGCGCGLLLGSCYHHNGSRRV